MSLLKKYLKIISLCILMGVFCAQFSFADDKLGGAIPSMEKFTSDEIDREFTKALEAIGKFRKTYRKSKAIDVSEYFKPITTRLSEKEFEAYLDKRLGLSKGPAVVDPYSFDGKDYKRIYAKGTGVTGLKLLYYSRYFSVDDEVAFAYEYTNETYLTIKKLNIVLMYKGGI